MRTWECPACGAETTADPRERFGQDACTCGQADFREISKNFLLINLFDRKVEKETAFEVNAEFDCAGMAGMVVVDRAGRRIYDGEYQVWSPIETYLRAFPVVKWLEDHF